MKTGLDNFLECRPDQGMLARLTGSGNQAQNEPWVARVSDACLIGPLTVFAAPGSRLHALDLEDGTIIPDFASGPKFQPAWTRFRAEAQTRRAGSYLALHGYRSYNFWHWTMESLVKLMAAEMAGFTGKIIVPPSLPQNRFVAESLEMLGIDWGRILPYDGKPWWVETLFVPRPIEGYSNLRFYPELFYRLRRRLLASVEVEGPPLRIYISRSQAKEGRRIVNEEELVKTLEKFGFHRLIMEDLPLREQIGLAARAECLLGPHGAGMTHSFFMPSDSLVLEFFPRNYVNPCILPVVDILKHRYFMFPSANYENDPQNDIRVMVYAVELTLRRELIPSRTMRAGFMFNDEIAGGQREGFRPAARPGR